mmetsp:Transcript_49559/g.125926  ORF Transcript_49559/g.125926 Transcript_49559/m.125926 type:complete len:207 (-) Transcript_49559:81-701(-)
MPTAPPARGSATPCGARCRRHRSRRRTSICRPTAAAAATNRLQPNPRAHRCAVRLHRTKGHLRSISPPRGFPLRSPSTSSGPRPRFPQKGRRPSAGCCGKACSARAPAHATRRARSCPRRSMHGRATPTQCRPAAPARARACRCRSRRWCRRVCAQVCCCCMAGAKRAPAPGLQCPRQAEHNPQIASSVGRQVQRRAPSRQPCPNA